METAKSKGLLKLEKSVSEKMLDDAISSKLWRKTHTIILIDIFRNSKKYEITSEDSSEIETILNSRIIEIFVVYNVKARNINSISKESTSKRRDIAHKQSYLENDKHDNIKVFGLFSKGGYLLYRDTDFKEFKHTSKLFDKFFYAPTFKKPGSDITVDILNKYGTKKNWKLIQYSQY